MSNLSDIVNSVHGDEANSLTKDQINSVAKDVFVKIQQHLNGGNEVNIAGFGKFTVVERAARTARNPITGESVDVAAKNAVKFKPSKALKDSV